MSYSEADGQVVLTMSREDFEELDSCVKLVQIFEAHSLPSLMARAPALRDRLNEGNPNYTPYQVKP